MLQGELTQNQSNALHVITQEKAALLSLIETSNVITDLLLSEKADAVERIRSGEFASHLEAYLMAELVPMLEKEMGITPEQTRMKSRRISRINPK